MTIEIDAILEALAEPTRREIFERIVARPRRIGELAVELPITRSAVSHHVRVLRDAGLVEDWDGAVQAIVDSLPTVRMYFDRLWLEAALGDTWLAQRRTETRDFGL